MMQDCQKEVVKTTCPRDCYDGCGISVFVRNGEITRVVGNQDHPNNKGPLCMKCSTAYNGVWRDSEARLLYPMRRSGPKGSGQFERISWDVALEEIASKFQSIIKTNGADKIYHNHYTGTCSLLASNFPNRFFDHIGATNINSDTVCNNAGHVAWDYVFGDSLNGFDPRVIKDSNCVLVWGANPSASAPHVDKLWLDANEAKVIVVDPIAHETAKKADIHLQLRPGSDAALAFTLLHVIKRDGLLDEDYINACVAGYEDVVDMIEECTPNWGEDVTDVPAKLIEEAARLYADGPSIMWLGQGLQRQPTGGNIFRSCAMLSALTGNIGKAGTGAYYINDTFAMAANKGILGEDEGEEDRKEAIVSQMDMPDLINDPTAIRAFVVWNSNPAASNPNQTKMLKGLAREDLFTLVVDCFMTDSAMHADIILPAASFLEFDDLCASYFHLTVGPQVKAGNPMGESLPNQEIFRRLAAVMKLTGDDLYETDQDMIDAEMAAMAIGVDWADLKERGWTYISDEPLIIWGDGKYTTPSGKIEIASPQAAADGLPLTPVPHVDASTEQGKFRLITPADKHLMNSSYGNDPKLLEKMGSAEVIINPLDADAKGISEGDEVTLSNQVGQLTLMASLNEMTPKGVLLSYKSRWPLHEKTRANINILHQAQKTDMGESTSVHGTIVNLTKAR